MIGTKRSQGMKILGHKVTSASSGNTAARILGEQRFDLLITDVLITDGDGLGLIERFKVAEPAVNILASSGGGKSDKLTKGPIRRFE